MKRAKISIIGAGNVGATAAHWAVSKELGDVVLIDIPEITITDKDGTAKKVPNSAPAGKALDLSEASPIELYDAKIYGGADYAQTADSDVVIITAGIPRKPGMSRDDLISINTGIVKAVAENVAKHSPNAVLIVVSNPLDAMVYVAWKASGFKPNKVVGMAGILDVGRYKSFIAEALNVSVEDISALLMGGHGDDMVPLPRFTSIGGVPLLDLMPLEQINKIVDRAKNGGLEIVNLLRTGSAYYAPSAAAIQMAEAIIKDKKRVLPCAAFCQNEYGVGGYFVGVPAVLGKDGVEKVIEAKLTDDEKKLFQNSVNHVKELVASVKM